MRTLYIDCFSGISGDMTIGALLDTGISIKFLEEELFKLGIHQEYELKTERVNKNGISSLKFDVLFDDHHEHGHHHHHHDHNHVQEHDHAHDHGHHHEHEHNHQHDHHHIHDHHHHRTYKDIVELIANSELSDSVKEISQKIFRVIGEAEAKIHGMDLEKVHFHEVGAIDSIIDIVGTAILIDKLAVNQIIASPVPTGSGRIKIDHGIYPVPAPATLEILKNVPLQNIDVTAELTTPTGAAIIKVLVDEFSQSVPSMKINQTGYGAGTKTFREHPNVLRVMLGDF
ncbi:LarC family nickel insertion protein [Gracilibacillus dipsosauri]|uniref:LarC family nickel insertion protein n=1 Tax=Gracilibacillus dipsosauri TaxID=178340 RepID=UPI00240A591E